MKMKWTVVLLVPFLGGCLTTQSKQDLGTWIGGAVGGVAGAKIAHNARLPGALGGAAIGAFIGNSIGKYLDEQDRQRMSEATIQTAESGQPQVIHNPQSGTVIRTAAVDTFPVAQPASKPVRRTSTPTPAPSKAPTQVAKTEVAKAATPPEKTCRVVRQTVELRDGTREVEDVTLCKGANGWEAA